MKDSVNITEMQCYYTQKFLGCPKDNFVSLGKGGGRGPWLVFVFSNYTMRARIKILVRVE